jgi:hypothetical protein
LGKCRNCLKSLFVLFNCVCCKKDKDSAYEQDITPNDRTQSSIEEEKTAFVYNILCEEDINELNYNNLKNKELTNFNLSKCCISRDLKGYAKITKKHHNLGDRHTATKGFKVHVSVDPKNIQLAWEIAMPLLVQYGIYEFKVILNLNNSQYQPGKEIVIYEMSSKENLPWSEILNQLEYKLYQANVQTYKTSKHRCGKIFTEKTEPMIINSRYLYYTDDRIDLEELDSYNWNNSKNPFKNIIINQTIKQEACCSSNYRTT